MAFLTAAFCIKLALAWYTKGSTDVYIWTQFVRDVAADGVGVYRRPYEVTFFNHPPFMIHICLLWNWLQQTTGIPIHFWIRFFPAVADIGSFLVLYHLILRRQFSAAWMKPMMWWVCAPVGLIISGFHGNTDPVMIFFFLLCISLIENEYSILWAGLALGLSMCLKVVPLLFIPVLFFNLGWRRFIQLWAVAAAVFVIAGLPYIAQDTLFLLHRIFGYSGAYGWWGISRILTMWAPPSLFWLDTFFHSYGQKILFGLVVVAAWWMNRLPRRPSLYEQSAMTLLIFFAITPGFATQYLAWLLPFVLVLSWRSQIAFHVTTAFYLCFAYSVWFVFGPTANAALLLGTPWGNSIRAAELLCWFTIVILAFQYGAYLRREEKDGTALSPDSPLANPECEPS